MSYPVGTFKTKKVFAVEGDGTFTQTYSGVISGYAERANDSIKSTGKGSMAFGWAEGTDPYTSTISAEADGAFANGFAKGDTVNTEVKATKGGFAQGYAKNTQIYAEGGGFAQGYALGGQIYASGGGFAQGEVFGLQIYAGDGGSFAQGSASFMGEIKAQGTGTFAQGYIIYGAITAIQGGFAQGKGFYGDIYAKGEGAFAQGLASGGNNIYAKYDGSFAHGKASSASIESLAVGAVQFGEGSNSLADSLRVKASPRLCGGGAPGAPANGDIWEAAGYVYIRSNGVSCKVVNNPL